jgi:predicted DNA-binding transcriptional regulator YafY
MSKAKDTLLRLFALLRLIPQHPRHIATTTLLEKLHDRGFSVDMRTVQRDLGRLSVPFSLLCDESVSPYRWSLNRDSPMDLRDMDPPSALALYLAEDHLKALLPQSVLDLLAPQFRIAHNYLGDLEHNGFSHWASRVRALPNGKTLRPAQVAPGIWGQVSAALLEHRQLQVSYLSRSKAGVKSFRLHPAGMVSRHSISYLLATVEGYNNVLQFALHRIHEAKCLDLAANRHEALDLDAYLDGGGFNSLGPLPKVELIADVSPQIAWLLAETPLSPEQDLHPLPGTDWQRLRACVPQDQETLWWIFGLNDNIKVLEPQVWVEEITQKLEGLSRLYAQPA